MTKVKICGITNLADARFASGAGAEYLGFIQHESSPRYISPDLAKDIISWVYGAHPVGVFVDKPADEVNSICEKAGFSFAQLHGSESAAYCEWIDRPIIKAIPVTQESTAESLQQAMNVYAHVAEFLLLDTASATSFGGSGKAFDWSILAGIQAPLPLFLAGGLNVQNVAAAISACSPYAVDVASGVEESPGKKDYVQIDAFMQAVLNGVAR